MSMPAARAKCAYEYMDGGTNGEVHPSKEMKKGIYVIMMCAGLLAGCGSNPQVEAEGSRSVIYCQCCNPKGEDCKCCLCN